MKFLTVKKLKDVFRPAAQVVGDPYPFLLGTLDEQARLQKILRMLKVTRNPNVSTWGMRVVEKARAMGTSLLFNSSVGLLESEAQWLYAPLPDGRTLSSLVSCLVHMNPAVCDEELAMRFGHEVRHVAHDRKGYNPPYCSLFDLIRLIRFLEADAESYCAVGLLEMAVVDGIENFFERAQKSKNYGHIYDAILKEYRKDKSGLYDGRIRRVAFDEWFTDDSTLQLYEYQTYKLYHRLREDPEHHDQQIVSIEPEDLRIIGQLEREDRDYLSLPGFRPLDHPHYTRLVNKDLRDLKFYQVRLQVQKELGPGPLVKMA